MSNSKWPTLEGRLSQPLTSRKQALLQLHKSYLAGWISMSEKALEEVERYIEQDKKLQETRKKIQAALDAQPKSVTFDEAYEQVSKKKSISSGSL